MGTSRSLEPCYKLWVEKLQLPQIFVKELPLNAGSATSVYLIADPAKLFNFAQRTFQIGEVAPVLKKNLNSFWFWIKFKSQRHRFVKKVGYILSHIVHFYSIQPDCQNFKIIPKAFLVFMTKSFPYQEIFKSCSYISHSWWVQLSENGYPSPSIASIRSNYGNLIPSVIAINCYPTLGRPSLPPEMGPWERERVRFYQGVIKLARLLQKLETSTNCNEYDHCLFKSIDNQSRQRHTICMQQIIILIPGSQNLKLANRCSRWRKPSIRKKKSLCCKISPPVYFAQ